MKELVLGCGHLRQPRLKPAYEDPTTLDINADVSPDVVWDLNHRPLPFEDGEFDQIHAYEVLEHIGTLGDWRGFFEEFEEYHRLLRKGGKMFITVPCWDSVWAFGDPGHTRVLNEGSFVFLDQDEYEKQAGSPMTDYRSVYRGDFTCLAIGKQGDTLQVVLEAK